MAGVADEVYMGRGWELTQRGISLDRLFMVRQVASESEALQTLAALDPPVVINGRHNSYAQVRCRAISRGAGDLGPRAMYMRAVYEVPEYGHFEDKTIDVLQRKTKIRWGKILEVVDMERDLDNRWVCNSAGFLPTTPLRKSVIRRQLFVTRYEPSYDILRAENFENTVNLEPFWLGPLRILSGQCKCNTIIPDTEYDFGAEWVHMLYEFEFSTWAIEPYQARMIDRGATGWATVGGVKVPGRFGVSTGSGDSEVFEAADEEVLLKGDGTPVDSHWKVGAWNGSKMVGYAPTTPPVVFGSYAITDNAPSWIRKWRSVEQRDFSFFGFS